jgi:SNF2 family DNA or RNA helicase
MTGTPVPNGIEGLWSQMFIVDEGGKLGQSLTAFRYEYMQPSYRPGVPVALWEAQPGALERLTDKVAPLVMQLRASDYLELPDYVFNEITVEIPRKEYDELAKELILQLDNTTILSANAAANMNRLRQIANGTIYTEGGKYAILHNEKLDALEDLLTSLDGKPCLLLYQFRHDLARIQKHLNAVIPTLSGASASTSTRLCEQFVAGEIPILAGHPASMGHGLNLQGGGAHHIIWFGVDYNLEYWQQTLQRLRRQGNTAPAVHVHTIVAANSVEQVAAATLQDKNSNQELFLARVRHIISIPKPSN